MDTRLSQSSPAKVIGDRVNQWPCEPSVSAHCYEWKPGRDCWSDSVRCVVLERSTAFAARD